MSTNYGGLILPDADEVVTSVSVKDNFQKVVNNQTGAVAPASPVIGQSWFDTSVPPGTLRVWNGASWSATASSGFSGFSGFSGLSSSGFSGFSGLNGAASLSGYSGATAASGYSGVSGYSSTSGYSGASGYSGTSAYSGYSGASGQIGVSGFSGLSGVSPIGEYGYNVTAGNTGPIPTPSPGTWVAVTGPAVLSPDPTVANRWWIMLPGGYIPGTYSTPVGPPQPGDVYVDFFWWRNSVGTWAQITPVTSYIDTAGELITQIAYALNVVPTPP